jgi:hypothetical protein
MGGSNLRMSQKQTNLIDGDHRRLFGRTAAEQHPMDAIYRLLDKKPLPDVLDEIRAMGSNLVFEYFPTVTQGQTTIMLTDFSYNPVLDKLLVIKNGMFVFEGIEEDYIQSTETALTFNYPLNSGDKVFVILGGTLTSETFGSVVHDGIIKFTQLKDVPNNYSGMSGKVATVSDNELGIVFRTASANTALTEVNGSQFVANAGSYVGWLQFVPMGMIKGIRLTPADGYVGQFELKIKTKDSGGKWVYASGLVDNILWDIMDIPFIDESGSNSIYIEISNNGNDTTFELQIYVIE